eukprot:TRINITY_DN9742_c0_g1_i1.p1 TRINITY_DN9742_c0_g1~~TRINITY_DN9742_c0_g1_i1.p1  ORF type:complete len:326 (-),score=63.72 TRINITY_DN9742_c0_g1_i1:110-1087(-)
MQHHSGPIDLVMPDTSREDLLTVISFIYTGRSSIQASRLQSVTEIAVTLGLSSLLSAMTDMMNKKDGNLFKECNKVVKSTESPETSASVTNRISCQPRLATSSSPTFFERRSSSPLYSVSPHSRSVSPVPASHKRSMSPSEEDPAKKLKLGGVPLLQSILTQLPRSKHSLQSVDGKGREKEHKWPDNLTTPEMGFMGTDFGQFEALGKLQGLRDHGAVGSFPSCSNQLASLLSAAAKLKQVAEQAMQGSSPESKSEFGSRKLAFHEPRPCPICSRMYRDAATLRTHAAIMHSEGAEPFRCSCGITFGTKFEMYQHKKAGHPPVKS